jgi:hypothetical protein
MTETGAGLRKYARELEESFFERENRRLLEKMRAEAAQERQRERLRAALKIDDDALLDRFIELDLCPETVMALGLVPLVFAAWADGEIQSREREAILRAAAERSIPEDSDNYRMLKDWLEHRPDSKLFQSWQHYVRAVIEDLDPALAGTLRERIVNRVRGVAEAAGGFLGLNKISDEEQAVIDEVEHTLE